MDQYCVNKNTDNPGGHHEVHTLNCSSIPTALNRIYLGMFDSCRDALIEAGKQFPNNVDGCVHCCIECHKG